MREKAILNKLKHKQWRKSNYLQLNQLTIYDLTNCYSIGPNHKMNGIYRLNDKKSDIYCLEMISRQNRN